MWGAIEADFQREYGVDLSEPGILKRHTWRWFTTRLRNLSTEAMTRREATKAQRSDPGAAMSALAAAAR